MADPRLTQVLEEHRQRLAEEVERHGLAATCRLTGLGRAAVLGIIARGACMPAQSFVLRAWAERQEAA